MDKGDRDYLAAAFRDLLNYSAEDPTEPIDPLTYKTPEGDSCLHYAAMRGDLRAAQILLDAGLDPNLLGDMSCTPLHYARKLGHRNVVDLLIARGASPNLINEFGEKALEQEE
jgi:ankyrin repeat protein